MSNLANQAFLAQKGDIISINNKLYRILNINNNIFTLLTLYNLNKADYNISASNFAACKNTISSISSLNNITISSVAMPAESTISGYLGVSYTSKQLVDMFWDPNYNLPPSAEDRYIWLDNVSGSNVKVISYNTQGIEAVSASGTDGSIRLFFNANMDNIDYTIQNPKYIYEGEIDHSLKLQTKTVYPDIAKQIIEADSGYLGLNKVYVEAFSPAISGGLDTSDATAIANDILASKTAYVNGSKITGTIPTRNASDLSTSGSTVTVPSGYYASAFSKAISNGSVTVNTPSIDTSTGVITGTASVNAGYVSGTPASATLPLSTQAAKTITPSASSQTAVAAGKYTTGAVTVAAVPTEAPDTITSNGIYSASSDKWWTGVTVNVSNSGGTNTSDATATASDIIYDKIAYGSSGRIIGAMVNNGAVLPDALNAGGSYSIPAGYHNGEGVVTTVSLENQTGVESGKSAITINSVLSGYQGWVNGSRVTGTIPAKNSSDLSISGNTVTIPAGYYSTVVNYEFPEWDGVF